MWLINKFTNVLILFGLTVLTTAEKRTLSVFINPFCGDICNQTLNGSYPNLIWIQLKSQTDTIHYLYTNVRTFTVMIFRTSTNSTLLIDWKAFLSTTDAYKSIIFNPYPIEYAAYAIPQIYEFNDENGIANMSKIPNNQSYWQTYKTTDLKWSMFRNLSNISGLFEASRSGDNQTNGTFKFLIKYPGLDNERDIDLPHLLLNSASNSIDFIIDSITPMFKHSKFAINIQLVDFKQMNATLITKRTLDDEYTPGTFNLWNIEMSEQVNNSTRISNYIQWKPIFYFDNPRILENSTITYQYDLKWNQPVSNCLANVFVNQELFGYSFNVSFGLEGDDKDGYFYSQTNYSVWSFSIGLGSAPVDKMSYIVSLVIIIGFGLPVLVIAVGLAVLIVRKLKRNDYSEI